MKKGKSNEKKSETTNSKKTRQINYWAISTVVLAIALLVTLITNNYTGQVVSAEEAAQNVIDFAAAQGATAELVSTSDNGSLYEIILTIQGQETPVYVTKDGKNLVPYVYPLEIQETSTPTATTPETTEIAKSSTPQVELYVWSYCPYGVQAQGPLAEVANLLGDGATFTIVPYYDGHGAYENQQNKIQSCIQKLSPEKYWDYAAGFVDTIYSKCSGDIECDETESVKLMNSLGIDSESVMSCVETEGDALFAAASAKAKAAGVTGSPTLIINGAKASVARNAEAFKTAVCSAYENAPAECSETLDATAAAAAGNC